MVQKWLKKKKNFTKNFDQMKFLSLHSSSTINCTCDLNNASIDNGNGDANNDNDDDDGDDNDDDDNGFVIPIPGGEI